MLLRFALTVLVGLVAVGASAQPSTLRHGGATPLDAVPVLRLPSVSNAALLARDAAAAPTPNRSLRFAEPFSYALDARAGGLWEQVGPDRVWRLVIESPTAYSLNFGFSRFRLPEGARLWIYAPGTLPEYRPFTSDDNEAHGELWTPIVPGPRTVIELNLADAKPGAEDEVELELGQVAHAYRPSFLTAEERTRFETAEARLSGACNVDVVCPQGDPYRDIIRSVGAYTRSGTDICSGVAVNTTRGDAEPNFLTANHCGNSSGNAPSVVVYWNYQNSTCRTPGSPASGGPGNGSRSQFNSGTIYRGGGAASDWNLLTFDDPILPSAQVYLAGWDRRDVAPSRVVAIHHPRVEEKRISFENDPTSITTYLSATPSPTATHIRVEDWDLGTTEGGSSGSPIFNPDQRIVGQLHGGFASCTSRTADWYGRMFHSMTTGLGPLLDPINSGAQTVNGREANSALFAAMSATPTALGRDQTARVTVTVTNSSTTAANGIQFAASMPTHLALAGNVVASAGSASGAGTAVSWTVSLAPGASASVAYDVRVGPQAPLGTITHQGTVTHASLETPATVSAVFQVVVPPDYAYETVEAVPIPDNQCPAEVSSTIVVPGGFTSTAVRVGVNLTHTYRGDLRIRVQSPSGTSVRLLDRVGGGADNLDALFHDLAPAGAFASGAHNVGLPHYEVEGRPTDALAAVTNTDPVGTWRLSVCDAAGVDVGQINRWALQFFGPPTTSGEPAVVATSEVTVEAVRPNPAVGTASLRFAPRVSQAVRAVLVDATGREVATLLDREVPGGVFETVVVETAGLSPGAYFVRVVGATFVETRALSVVR